MISVNYIDIIFVIKLPYVTDLSLRKRNGNGREKNGIIKRMMSLSENYTVRPNET